MDMPNTDPQTTTMAEIDKKIAIAESKSLVNFSCYLGATNENIDEVVNVDKNKVCGIKVF